jgi:hypothetical protein
MNEHPKVFISHATEDKERFVLRFAERLRGNGIDAWLDRWEMLPGDKLVTKIFENGLQPSDVVIVVLSKTSINKPWVQKELDTAVVKSIEQQTRLIPIRLDKCDIPPSLKDGTLYQEIPDLENYDAEFERIVNAIYGQYEKPPLGAAPPYVRSEVLQIGDLTRIDSIIFEHACRIAVEQGHADGIDADRLIGDLNAQDISEAQIMESQEILEGRFYIELYSVMGPPHVYDFKITTHGFDQFANAGIPNWGQLLASVARILVREVIQNQGQTSKHAIADELQQPKFLVEHVFKVFKSKGWIKYGESIGGDLFMDVFWVSPELKRKLEG